MKSETQLIGGGMVMLALSTSALVVVPYLTVRNEPAPAGLKPYSSAALRGRQVYIANGCVYCHSQQPRAQSFAPDFSRGWGRATVAGDYAYDNPHLLGTMRTGPDLMNIGVRQPSAAWHLGHLYQPRAFVPGSLMPGYPFLFTRKARAEDGDVTVVVPGAGGAGVDKTVVVASREALDLVSYLQSLDRSYAIDTGGPAPAASASASASQKPKP